MLKNLLFTCGLNESEQAVLIVLMERGPSIASLLAKRTGMKRPTVYAALENLLRIGAVTKQQRDHVSYFAAIKPEILAKVFENRARHQFEAVTQASKLLSEPLQELAKNAAQDFGGYMISSVDSTESLYAELENVLLGGDFCAFFNPQVTIINDEMRRLVMRFLDVTSQKKPHIREILVSGPITDWYNSYIDNPNHLLKEVPAGSEIISDIIMINGAVLLCHYRPKDEVGIKITQKEFYTSMMVVFDMMWERL